MTPSPPRPEAAVPDITAELQSDIDGIEMMRDAFGRLARDVRLTDAEAHLDLLERTRAELAALREKQRKLESALHDLLEMSECDPRDFDGKPPGAYGDCMEDAQRQARRALGGDDADKEGRIREQQ